MRKYYQLEKSHGITGIYSNDSGVKKMLLRNPGFYPTYTKITSTNDSEPTKTLMEFGLLRLSQNQDWWLKSPYEKAVLLLTGEISVEWMKPGDEKPSGTKIISRQSIFDQLPYCLLTSAPFFIHITALSLNTECAIILTENPSQFNPTWFTPEKCRSEERGKGLMRETSTRIVRTIFDQENMPSSNLVLGEVINFPGKWSSYPPHHHPQPEIYHYRFLPYQGFGFGMLGYDDVACVRNGDTVLILNDVVHSQTSAPGYAMYYLWVIRNLEGNPYGTVHYDEEHKWVMDAAQSNKIWPVS